MAVIENAIEVGRSAEEVFDYLSDQRSELEWNPDCVSMEKLMPGPVGVGTRFRAKWKQGPFVTTEVTRYDRPTAWTYENDGPITSVLTVTLDRLGDERTRLTSHGEWGATGLARVIFPIFIRRMRRAEKSVLQNAKRVLEERRDRSS